MKFKWQIYIFYFIIIIHDWKFISDKYFLLYLLFLGSSYTVFSQSPVIITDPGITTWDVPTGVTSVTVECWGAGGSGGSSGNNAAGGGGGYDFTVSDGSSSEVVASG